MRPTTGGRGLVTFRPVRALGVESEEDEPVAAAEEGAGVGGVGEVNGVVAAAAAFQPVQLHDAGGLGVGRV